MHNSFDDFDVFFLEAWDYLLESLSIRASFMDFPERKTTGLDSFSVNWLQLWKLSIIFNGIDWFHIGSDNNKPAKKINAHHRRQEVSLEWSTLIKSWTKAQPVNIGRNTQKSVRQFVLSVVMIWLGDGGMLWWMEVFVPVDLFTAPSYGAMKQWGCLWECSQEPDPTSQIQMEISVCAFFPSHDPTPRKTSHLWNPSGLGSGSGRGEVGLTQKGDSVPRYSRFRLTVWTKMHLWQCWQNWQELLLDAELRNLWGSASAGCSIKLAVPLYLETETLLVWRRVLHLSAGKTLCVESNSFYWLRLHKTLMEAY